MDPEFLEKMDAKRKDEKNMSEEFQFFCEELRNEVLYLEGGAAPVAPRCKSCVINTGEKGYNTTSVGDTQVCEFVGKGRISKHAIKDAFKAGSMQQITP